MINLKIKKIAVLAVLAVGALCKGGFCSSENAGASGVPALNYDVGGRQVGMGGAFTAVADDIFGLQYNPAVLGRLRDINVGGMFRKGILDTNVTYVAFSTPFSFADRVSPSFGMSLLYSRNGDIEWYKTNPDGSPAVVGESISAGSDLVLSAGYGENIFVDNMGDLLLEHYLGAMAKLVYSQLPGTDGEMIGANAFAVDVGYLANSRDTGTTFGLSVLNLGGSLTYIEEKTPLPLTARAGVAQKFTLGKGTLNLALDGIRYFEEKATRLRVGAEADIERFAKLRLGYRFLEDGASGGLSAGFGVSLKGLAADFGMIFNGDLDTIYQFSVSYRFGRGEESYNESQYPSVRKSRTSRSDVIVPLQTPKSQPGRKTQP
ncbi:MAG: PorV/PorQ family protein, partial [Elusimicrobia bacterium]|nr:PorV/PorQ family protein [Elusimicrobiota bacterium]